MVVSDDDESDEGAFAAVAKETASKPAVSRTGRAAASKPKKYADGDSGFDESDDDVDMLGDVSAMVKGIGGNSNEGATRLYHPPSASRPSSSHGVKLKPKRLAVDMEISDDETDWAALAQNSPQKATHHTILSEDDNSMVLDDKPLPKAAAKAAPKSKPAAVPKAKGSTALKAKKPAAPAPVISKPPPLSPAAKAYAAKQAKGRSTSSSWRAQANCFQSHQEEDRRF